MRFSKKYLVAIAVVFNVIAYGVVSKIKIDIQDKKTVKVILNQMEVAVVSLHDGLWIDEKIVENENGFQLCTLDYPESSKISFNIGAIEFTVHINGNVEIFGAAEKTNCILECPIGGKVIIPEGKELTLNRFACITRNEIENYGTINILKAWFCIDQTITNKDRDSVSECNKLLLLNSTISGGELRGTCITLENGKSNCDCHCLYGLDRNLGPICTYPNYPNPIPSTIFVNYNNGKSNFLYVTSGKWELLPFKEKTQNLDYKIPFKGETVCAFIAKGNHGAATKFDLALRDTQSGRILNHTITQVPSGNGASLNTIASCCITNPVQILFRQVGGFMLYEGSDLYPIPVFYFFKMED